MFDEKILIIQMPTIIGKCCALFITRIQPQERNSTRLFDMLRGITNVLVIDLRYLHQDSTAEEIIAPNYPRFSPPVILPTIKEKQVKLLGGK